MHAAVAGFSNHNHAIPVVRRRMKRTTAINSFETAFSFYSFLLILVGGQKFLENRRVQFAVGEVRAELAFVIVVNFLAVEDFDFFNQPVERSEEHTSELQSRQYL